MKKFHWKIHVTRSKIGKTNSVCFLEGWTFFQRILWSSLRYNLTNLLILLMQSYNNSLYVQKFPDQKLRQNSLECIVREKKVRPWQLINMLKWQRINFRNLKSFLWKPLQWIPWDTFKRISTCSAPQFAWYKFCLLEMWFSTLEQRENLQFCICKANN